MKAVILAAGFGSRLMPYTANIPKGMVQLGGVPLISRQVSTMRTGGISNITIIGGYRLQHLEDVGCPIIENLDFETTNMVTSLFKARELFDDSEDIIIGYGDIIYQSDVLDTLKSTGGEIVVTTDRNWMDLWKTRMSDPLDDAETFKIDDQGYIVELGQKAQSINEIHGQYIGLIKISKGSQKRLLEFYDGLDPALLFEGRPHKAMYLTTLLQLLIQSSWQLTPAWIENGWLEIDTVEDLQIFHQKLVSNTLPDLINLESAGGKGQTYDDILPGISDFISARVILVRSEIELPTSIYVDTLISGVFRDVIPLAEQLELLDRIARKIEIVGRVFECYSTTDFKPAHGAVLASSTTLEALVAVYLCIFICTQDIRYINTVVKALNGELSTNHDLDWPPELMQWADSAANRI